MTTAEHRLGGRYELGRTLGYGGMAEVFYGRDIRLGREVAVKVLRADLARDPSFLARFRREAQAAASLNHPAIVSVYDTGEDHLDPPRGPLVPYIVMEYVDGRTLQDILHDHGRVLPARALEIVADVCDALEFSHRAGIVHRDVKPGNVMVTRTGEVKVMDFGIARALAAAAGTATQTAAVVGTAQYLSPEQARGEHVDARSDVYSTGCLLYELLCGTPPFTGDSPVAVAYQHVRQNAVPPSAYDAELTGAMDAIVLKAMAKNPANRYQSAEEMRADLRRALAGIPVEATPLLSPGVLDPTPPEGATLLPPVTGERNRRGLWWLLAALLLIGIAVVLAFSGVLSGSRGSAQDVSTPALVDSSLADASASLQRARLRLGQVTGAFSDRPVDTVLDQSPLPQILVKPGATVDVTVSKGIEMVPVPVVSGLSRNAAIQALTDAKLAPGDLTTQDDPAPAGQVLRSVPIAGTSVAAGTKVSLAVSSGLVAVPSVTGLDRVTATARLQDAGFVVDLTSRADASVAADTVVAQNPTGRARPGSTVTLVVAVPAPPTLSPPPTPTPSVPPSRSPTATPTPTPSQSPASPSTVPSGSPTIP